jgi:hypothetical protein
MASIMLAPPPAPPPAPGAPATAAAAAAAAPLGGGGGGRPPATWSDDHVNVRKDADVVFRIGPDKKPLYAHKLMLTEHSRVIRALKPLQRCVCTS